jgi:hypothetical protein
MQLQFFVLRDFHCCCSQIQLYSPPEITWYLTYFSSLWLGSHKWTAKEVFTDQKTFYMLMFALYRVCHVLFVQEGHTSHGTSCCSKGGLSLAASYHSDNNL